MKEFLAALREYPRAARLVHQHRMWTLLLVPGLIALLYFPVVAFLAFRWGGDLAGYLRDHWLPEFFNYKLVVWLLAVALWIAGAYLGFVLFRNVIMILYAPMLGYLSEQTERRAQPDAPMPEARSGIIQSASRGIGMSLLSLLLSVGSFAACLPLLLVPLVGELAMVLLLPLAQMFLAGHGFMDPALERRGYSIRQSFQFVWRNKLRVLGCGGGFLLLTAVPVLGWFLGPTLGVVAGTLSAVSARWATPMNHRIARSAV